MLHDDSCLLHTNGIPHCDRSLPQWIFHVSEFTQIKFPNEVKNYGLILKGAEQSDAAVNSIYSCMK
jgi:hypothetical protein